METGCGTEPSDALSDTERAVHGALTLPALHAFLDAWAQRRLEGGIAEVRFRAGRIDAVWGVELQDGRAVVIKAHRTPVDLDAARATIDAQRMLAAAGFPCAVPRAGPDEIDGRLLTSETLLAGATPGRSSTTAISRRSSWSRRLVRRQHRGGRWSSRWHFRLGAGRRHRSRHRWLRSSLLRGQRDRWRRAVEPLRGRRLFARLRGGQGRGVLDARTASGCRCGRLDPRRRRPLAGGTDRPWLRRPHHHRPGAEPPGGLSVAVLAVALRSPVACCRDDWVRS